MGYLIAFTLSSICPTKLRPKFPFTSILGETYELIFEHQQKKVQFISEKISVVPSITAFHCMSDFFELWGTDIKETNYWGKSIEIQPQGNTYFKILGENTYVFSNAYTIKISNLEGKILKFVWKDQFLSEILKQKIREKLLLLKGPCPSVNIILPVS